MRLFSRHAFGREIPVEGYKELSEQVVRYAAGLPLTIKVLGSFLCGKDDLEWKDALERLETVPFNETMKVLELSYIDLEEDYKEIFLDVACLLKGWGKDDAIRALESCGFRARIGLRVLELKSLITISENGRLEMHDHIEEMGKNIVRRVNPNKPEKHSRLWIKEEIVDILATNKGTQATKCITLDVDEEELNLEILMNGLANMKELRFLEVNDWNYIEEDKVSNWNFDEDSLHLPNALRFLRWDYYPFSSLPKTFQAKDLVGLQMQLSNMVPLWKDGEEKACLKLRFLKITHTWFYRTLDLSVAPNLETLILEDCEDLVEVHFEVTPNLKELLIKNCKRMEKLHMPAESPKLRSLELSNSKLRNLHLGITPNLETLSLKYCYNMAELHMPAECPKLVNLFLCNVKLRTLHLGITPNLETLSLDNCTDMVEVQIQAECPKLVNLELNNLKLTTLRLGITPKLETLKVNDCTDMVELQIPAECPKLVDLELNNLKLMFLHLGITPKLETLSLKDCRDLVEIIAPIGCLKTFRFLDLTDCGGFESFLLDKWFPLVDVDSLLGLYVTMESFGVKSWLTSFYIQHPVLSVGNLEKLISVRNLEISTVTIFDFQWLRKLTLEGDIPEVPEFVVQLEGLEELILLSTKIKHLPESICMLKNLKILELKSCWLLEKLPENLGQLQCLEKLILTECVFLQDIPNSICEMKCLKYFHLPYCIQVAELPKEIGRLECLEELDITGTGISRLPESILRVKGLRIVGFRWLRESFGFTTSEIKTSDDETYCYI